MIRKTRRKRTWFVAALLASGSLFATALPANAETGVSSSEIKLGITLPLTGAASPGYNKIGNAMNAYFKYVNDNGGVYGRKITLIQKNDEYSPQLSIAKTNELILKDKVSARWTSWNCELHCSTQVCWSSSTRSTKPLP